MISTKQRFKQNKIGSWYMPTKHESFHSTVKISNKKATSSSLYKITRYSIYFNKHWKSLEKAFLCYLWESFNNGAVRNLILIPWNPQSKPLGLYFSKEGQKGYFKIVMQICADEWISLTCFYCLSIVISKSRQKVFN